MNLSNPHRPSPYLANPLQNKRAFGKDITNIAKGANNDHLVKKISNTLPFQNKPEQTWCKKQQKDAIHDYHEQIINYISSFPKKKHTEIINSEVSEKMRQILIDWLVDVHRSFQLKDQTLFLALQYLEEYQSMAHMTKEQYQLVGITCLWIASKYEEIYPPRMRDYVEVTAGAYTSSEMKAMEGNIISALGFDLNRVTPLALLSTLQLECFQNCNNAKCFNLARYLLEMSCLSASIFRRCETKMMVMAAVELADKIYRMDTNTGLFVCDKESIQFLTCHKELFMLLQGENKYKLTAIKRKYQQQKYSFVGNIVVKLQA